MSTRHEVGLALVTPKIWDSNQTKRGKFFEDFIGKLLSILGYDVLSEVRVTGAELDLIANKRNPIEKSIVECKFQKDLVSAEIINKLIGILTTEEADKGLLFTTSGYGKDAKGLIEKIKEKPLGKRLAFYGPQDIIEQILSIGLTKSPEALEYILKKETLGKWTLIVTPDAILWHIQIIKNSIPKFYAIIDGEQEKLISEFRFDDYKGIESLFSGLSKYDGLSFRIGDVRKDARQQSFASQVLAGTEWDDLRPARPIDFIGRDKEITRIKSMVMEDASKPTATKIFGVSAPSGWGKSSLLLKLCDLVNIDLLESYAISIDCRSATSANFVSEAIMLAFKSAQSNGKIDIEGEILITDTSNPLSSECFSSIFEKMLVKKQSIIICFDQFEEIFAKEDLLDTFDIITRLSYYIDANHLPIFIGVAWKTDISLPQNHPAYHMWHSLSDRRINIRLNQFDKQETSNMIKKAQKSGHHQLKRQITNRIIDQSQGLPWLIKKLVLHIFSQIDSGITQFDLLEKQLDVKNLFDQDLAELQKEHVQCLKFVAINSPTPMIDVHESFDKATVNFLLQKNLIVKSGSNFVIYWDIFRDYLNESKVPYISWNRSFQRDHNTAIRAMSVIDQDGPLSSKDIASKMEITVRVFHNILTDLIALNLVDINSDGLVHIPAHMHPFDIKQMAEKTRQKFIHHSFYTTIQQEFTPDTGYNYEFLKYILTNLSEANSNYQNKTIDAYALNMLKWLQFSGLIEERRGLIYLANGYGAQFAKHYDSRKTLSGVFLGNSSPNKAFELLRILNNKMKTRNNIEDMGLRNALQDLISLNLVDYLEEGFTTKFMSKSDEEMFLIFKQSIELQDTYIFINEAASYDTSIVSIGKRLADRYGSVWVDTSCIRYVNGILRYKEWISENAGNENTIRLL